MCDDIIDPILGKQQWLILILFLLNMVYIGWVVGKCFWSNLKNILPIFVFTFIEQARLYQIIAYLRFLAWFASSMFTLFPCSLWSLYVIFPSRSLLFNAALYMSTFLSKAFLLHDIFVKHLNTAFRISAIMFGGWVGCMLM